MGKKAKLKKQRKQAQKQASPNTSQNSKSHHFIDQLERQGYSWKQQQEAPDVPENKWQSREKGPQV